MKRSKGWILGTAAVAVAVMARAISTNLPAPQYKAVMVDSNDLVRTLSKVVVSNVAVRTQGGYAEVVGVGSDIRFGRVVETTNAVATNALSAYVKVSTNETLISGGLRLASGSMDLNGFDALNGDVVEAEVFRLSNCGLTAELYLMTGVVQVSSSMAIASNVTAAAAVFGAVTATASLNMGGNPATNCSGVSLVGTPTGTNANEVALQLVEGSSALTGPNVNVSAGTKATVEAVGAGSVVLEGDTCVVDAPNVEVYSGSFFTVVASNQVYLNGSGDASVAVGAGLVQIAGALEVGGASVLAAPSVTNVASRLDRSPWVLPQILSYTGAVVELSVTTNNLFFVSLTNAAKITLNGAYTNAAAWTCRLDVDTNGKTVTFGSEVIGENDLDWSQTNRMNAVLVFDKAVGSVTNWVVKQIIAED